MPYVTTICVGMHYLHSMHSCNNTLLYCGFNMTLMSSAVLASTTEDKTALSLLPWRTSVSNKHVHFHCIVATCMCVTTCQLGVISYVFVQSMQKTRLNLFFCLRRATASLNTTACRCVYHTLDKLTRSYCIM